MDHDPSLERGAAGDSGGAEVVLPGRPLDATLAYFCSTLGLRLDAIFPADPPAVAVVSGHGVRLRLDAGIEGAPGILRLPRSLAAHAACETVAPNGTRIEWVESAAEPELPPLQPSLVVARGGSGDWTAGRA